MSRLGSSAAPEGIARGVALERVVLLGHEIGYSASPAIQNAAFAALGLAIRYELRDVSAPDLPAAVDDLRGHEFRGANVTRPHKFAVCELADELAPEVERLGAANTLVSRDGHLVAMNTDLAAIAEEIAVLAPRPRRGLVLGSGGASRAVQAALRDAGCDEVVVIRRETWDRLPRALASADLLVNATPVGTATDASPVPGGLLRPDLAVLDLVYRPSPTRLVHEARAAGGQARDGAGVLLRQAAASLTAWTGHAAPLVEMREALRVELGHTVNA